MRNFHRALIFALLAPLAASVCAEPASSAEQELIESARQWEADGREDLALAALQKLALVHPDDARLQLRLGVLELHTNRMADAASRLATLRKTQPQDPATQQLADEYRVATNDRLRMANVRRLAQVGEYDQALAGFNELFPEGPPRGALGAEYFHILDKSSKGGAAARAGNPEASDRTGIPAAVPARQSAAKRHTARHAFRNRHGPKPRSSVEAERADTARLDLIAERDADAQRWAVAETEYRGVLRLYPADATAAVGLAKALGATGRWQEAVDGLSAFEHSHPAAANSIASARAGILRARADAETQAGQFATAREDLETALTLTPADAWLRFDLARLYARLGQTDRGHALMTAGEAIAPADWDMRYAHALYLSGVDDRQGALSLLSAVPPAQRTAGMLRLERRLRVELATARADALAKSGHWAEAGAEYENLLRDDPANLDLRLAYARLLPQAGGREAALSILHGVARDVPPGDVDHRLAAARQLRALGDVDGARRCLATLRAANPNDADALLLAGQIASETGQRAEAFDDFQQAEVLARSHDQFTAINPNAAPPADNSHLRLTAVEDAAADLTRTHPAYVTGGLDFQIKPGDPGISRFRDFESPVEMRMPGPAAGTVMAQVDPVHVSAGTLPADFALASQFGKVKAFGPASLASFPSGAAQAQTGVALGAGYYSEHYRLDLGSTPVGFLVQNLAAGGEVAYRLGPFDSALGFSRRPVNSTLLSYAGARDPVTGEVWGGVMKTGLNAGLGHYEAKWGANASAGYYRLDGRKVRGNNETTARAYAYRLLYDSRDMDLSLGLSATYWSYARNLRYYSFGQGGYYSPQSYLAFGLPLDWEGRAGRLAYELRAIVSKTLSHENRSPYYPADPMLQQQAGNPYYSGGAGSGIGYDLRGNLEYQLDPHCFLGGRFEIDRSAFYSPDFFTLYFRYEFTPHWWPIAYPPRAPLPYTQY